MPASRGPQRLGDVLSELVALKGLAHSGAAEQLQEAWQKTAGDTISKATRVVGIRNRVLEIEVGSASLLYELDSFHKASLLQALRGHQPPLDVNGIKFRLKGSLGETQD